MSWRDLVYDTADVVLRVPPLFLMDSLLSGSFILLQIFSDSLPLYIVVLVVFMAMAGLFFSLSTQQLLDIYNYLLSMLILLCSSWWNLQYLLESGTPQWHDDNIGWMVLDTESNLAQKKAQEQHQNSSFEVNFIVQVGLALIFILFRTQGPLFKMMSMNRVGFSMLQGSVYLSLTLPIICGVGNGLNWQLPLISVGLPVVYMVVEFYLYCPDISKCIFDGYRAAMQAIRTFGVQMFIETQWVRLHIPVVLLTFWLTRVTYHFVYYGWWEVLQFYLNNDKLEYFNAEICKAVCKHVVVKSCETIIAVLGLTSAVSYVAHYLGIFMAFCIHSNNEEDKNMGTVSAILFFILALQTGLTGLEPDKRLVRLNRNFCLLFTALLHFVHSMVNPLLMSLSASRNMSFTRHLRVLVMCLLLLILPSMLLYTLWSANSISTWLLAVTAFSVEVMIKVVFSLMVYSLFLIDAVCDQFWEKLDDYVYYVKSAGSTIEFLFGIFLFCNGGWIMVFESGGTIRAVMMCIHAYFNIWLQAKKGWQIFMKRRTAVQKINSLPVATPEQLDSVNDICAICHSELSNARITRCNHFFHGVCLRKWLYVQDCCPLCHELIYAQEATASNDEGNSENIDTQAEAIDSPGASQSSSGTQQHSDPGGLVDWTSFILDDGNDDGDGDEDDGYIIDDMIMEDGTSTDHYSNMLDSAITATEDLIQSVSASYPPLPNSETPLDNTLHNNANKVTVESSQPSLSVSLADLGHRSDVDAVNYGTNVDSGNPSPNPN